MGGEHGHGQGDSQTRRVVGAWPDSSAKWLSLYPPGGIAGRPDALGEILLTPCPCTLGLDASTQHVTLQALDIASDWPRLVFESTTTFDRDLATYGTRHGILPSDDPRVAVAPPLMWADALDRVMAAFARSGLDVSRVAAISGSAQQHGSVYLNARRRRRSHRSIRRSRWSSRSAVSSRAPSSPVWLDTSTSDECREITATLGGAAEVARLTDRARSSDSRGRRFAGSRRRCRPPTRQTARIDLVSSFLASLLAGRAAPLEPGDASGMNLMDLARRAWAPAALAATAPARREASAHRAVIDGRRHARRRTGAIATVSPAAMSSSGPATIRAASSARGSSTRDASASRLARATRSSA